MNAAENPIRFVDFARRAVKVNRAEWNLLSFRVELIRRLDSVLNRRVRITPSLEIALRASFGSIGAKRFPADCSKFAKVTRSVKIHSTWRASAEMVLSFVYKTFREKSMNYRRWRYQ
ncbi:hypothetical protein NPIL_421731 [Nephila pilipes]|uniref:Uncharacterized protein n=1 Tax=Nephila pilipes TaxID=299642 RepID=A0A8X6TRR7_NEPPI|nr:hypothetical protein NPIL_421731 [Nephila pilipes]